MCLGLVQWVFWRHWSFTPTTCPCCVDVFVKYLHWFEFGGKHIPRVNSDLCWGVGALLLSRIKVVQHRLASHGISATQKNSRPLSAGGIMASVFWDSGVIYVDFLEHFVAINAQYYSNLFRNNVHQGIRRKDLGNCKRKWFSCITVLFHIW
jgi:hypothetical protein